jgi:hypothetical protein
MLETFLPGTEPHERCPLHGGTVVGTAFDRLSSWLKRIIK